MNSARPHLAWLSVALIVVSGLAGCTHPTTRPVQAEQYVPAEGDVGFDVMRLGSADAQERWLATYTDGARTTRFAIEWEPPAVSAAAGSPAVGKGKFLAQTDSDPLPLLDSLKIALQAKRRPSDVQKADELPFSYLLIGDHQTRTAGGSFQSNPSGNWVVMKIFLANDQAQVYFNLNPVLHKAEFSIKDAVYGDRVLAELAKVF